MDPWIPPGITPALTLAPPRGGTGVSTGSAAINTLIVNTLATDNLNGLWITSGATQTAVRNLVSIDNDAAVRVDGDPNSFEGTLSLKVSDGCITAQGLSSPGLDTGCTASGTSTAAVTPLTTLSGALFGQLSSADAANSGAVDGTGSIDYSAIQDWSSFSASERHWGRAGHGGISARGRCASGDRCAIWDWSVTLSSVLADPLGNPPLSEMVKASHVLTHTWSVASAYACQSQLFTPNWDGTHCSSLFLDYAFETIVGIPTENGLCDVGDDCTLARNYGAYAGEGLPEQLTPDPLMPATTTVPGFGSAYVVRYKTNGH
ncbi:MAG TPA: hypothetical protein VF331_21740 [Polyangiales bacterium]